MLYETSWAQAPPNTLFAPVTRTHDVTATYADSRFQCPGERSSPVGPRSAGGQYAAEHFRFSERGRKKRIETIV